MPDPLRSAQRSLLRVAIVAVALVAAAGLFARCARQRSAAPAGAGAVVSADATLPAIERALEPRLGASAAGARPVCAAVAIGEEPGAGARRRIFVLARCQQLCLRSGVVATGTGIGFPAAAVLVGDHVVGTEAPTDAHYTADVQAIFPPAARQQIDSDGAMGRVQVRMAERVRAAFPDGQWLGDQAPSGCLSRDEGAAVSP